MIDTEGITADLDFPAIRLVIGPEMPGIIGASFLFDNPAGFAHLTPAECRALGAAFNAAAEAATL